MKRQPQRFGPCAIPPCPSCGAKPEDAHPISTASTIVFHAGDCPMFTAVQAQRAEDRADLKDGGLVMRLMTDAERANMAWQGEPLPQHVLVVEFSCPPG